MKNPMTREQKHQAIDDNEDGHDMQAKRVTNGSSRGWFDRTASAGKDLDFSSWQYRRKPELIELWVNAHQHVVTFSSTKYEDAVAYGQYYSGGTIHKMVEDTDWVEPSPAKPKPEKKIPKCIVTGNPCGTDTRHVDHPCQCDNCMEKRNPWRPITKGEAEDPDWVEPEPQWISVKDRLPDKEGAYICLDNRIMSRIPAGEDITGEHFDGEKFIDWFNGCEYEAKHVTHWMPLPEPPEYE